MAERARAGAGAGGGSQARRFHGGVPLPQMPQSRAVRTSSLAITALVAILTSAALLYGPSVFSSSASRGAAHVASVGVAAAAAAAAAAAPAAPAAAASAHSVGHGVRVQPPPQAAAVAAASALASIFAAAPRASAAPSVAVAETEGELAAPPAALSFAPIASPPAEPAVEAVGPPVDLADNGGDLALALAKERRQFQAAFEAMHGGDYRRTQFVPTPFPDDYRSRLSRAAERLGLAVPDVFARHRRERGTPAAGAGETVCPPHDVDFSTAGGPARVAANPMARRMQEAPALAAAAAAAAEELVQQAARRMPAVPAAADVPPGDAEAAGEAAAPKAKAKDAAKVRPKAAAKAKSRAVKAAARAQAKAKAGAGALEVARSAGAASKAAAEVNAVAKSADEIHAANVEAANAAQAAQVTAQEAAATKARLVAAAAAISVPTPWTSAALPSPSPSSSTSAPSLVAASAATPPVVAGAPADAADAAASIPQSAEERQAAIEQLIAANDAARGVISELEAGLAARGEQPPPEATAGAEPKGRRARLQAESKRVLERVAALTSLMGAGGAGAPPLGRQLSEAPGPFAPPSVDALSRATVGLVVVSYNAPQSLAETLSSWAQRGLLDLVDDRVAVLSAALPEEISLCLAHGFRVYTARREETRLVVERHAQLLSKFEAAAVERFPLTRSHKGDPGRPATLVGPAQLMAYLEMATDVVIFCEKDYALQPDQTLPNLVRGLLATLSLLAGNTQVVRLRRTDDANREALPNCCTGECGNGFNNFAGAKCDWTSHLNWLALFCDPNGVEARARGSLKVCMDEGGRAEEAAAALGGVERPPRPAGLPDRFSLPVAAAGVAGGVAWVEPMKSYCFSLDHSGWSNNVAAFRRDFWISAMDHTAVLSGTDNGEFEVNAMLLCNYCPRHGCGSGPASTLPPAVCQLSPGIFAHVELDGFVNGRR